MGFMLTPKRKWYRAAEVAMVVMGAGLLGTWAWQNFAVRPPPPQAAASGIAAHPTPAKSDQPAQSTPPVPPAAQSQPVVRQEGPASASVVRLEATELTWVSLRNAGGKLILARLFVPGDEQNFVLPDGSAIRIGNAAGLKIRFNGQLIGPLGSHGEVREIVFSEGNYKVSVIE